MINQIKDYIPGVHKEGYIVLLIAVVATALAFAISHTLGTIVLFMTVLCVFFFRDPERVTPHGDSLVISPADGLVQQIAEVYPPQELSMTKYKMKRVSIFLSVFDVHVNRVPINGIVKALIYRPGKFINASFDKASEDNERETILIEANYKNTEIVVIQIAGLVARRIVCDLKENSSVISGSRFGIIKFGSRVDIYLPAKAKVNVMGGQRVVGGETIISDLSSIKESEHNNNNKRKQKITAQADNSYQ